MQNLVTFRNEVKINHLQELLSNKDGYLLLMICLLTLSGDSVSQLCAIINSFSAKIAEYCYKTINKALRNSTRGVNKDDQTPFGKPANLLKNPRLLYVIILHSPHKW